LEAPPLIKDDFWLGVLRSLQAPHNKEEELAEKNQFSSVGFGFVDAGRNFSKSSAARNLNSTRQL
jgi:hypothetical protein